MVEVGPHSSGLVPSVLWAAAAGTFVPGLTLGSLLPHRQVQQHLSLNPLGERSGFGRKACMSLVSAMLSTCLLLMRRISFLQQFLFAAHTRIEPVHIHRDSSREPALLPNGHMPSYCTIVFQWDERYHCHVMDLYEVTTGGTCSIGIPSAWMNQPLPTKYWSLLQSGSKVCLIPMSVVGDLSVSAPVEPSGIVADGSHVISLGLCPLVCMCTGVNNCSGVSIGTGWCTSHKRVLPHHPSCWAHASILSCC